MFYKLKSFVAFFKFLTCLLISRPFYVIRFTWKYFFHYIKVHTATRWTIRHSLMLLWFADLMYVTEEVTFMVYELMGLWIVTSSVTFIKSANQSSVKLCLFYICSINSHQTFRRRNLLAHREANDPRLPMFFTIFYYVNFSRSIPIYILKNSCWRS